MDYLSRITSEPTPQSEPLDGRQILNNAGGYVYPVDDWTRLTRFLILGSEGGSYYATERKLTLENVGAVKRCIQEDGPTTVGHVLNVTINHRSARADMALYTLALCAAEGDTITRQLALDQLPHVANTASKLMQFLSYVTTMRGWGRRLRTAVSNWYLEKSPSDVAYQVTKYRQRNKWSHRDILRQCHALADVDDHELRNIFQWITHGDLPPADQESAKIIHAFNRIQDADADTACELIRAHRMAWELVPSALRGERKVMEALSEHMPLVATIRNLGNLTRLGAIGPMNCEATLKTIGRIGEPGATFIHPLNLLHSLMVYRAGKGERGRHTWKPITQIVDALDEAFERSFHNAPQSGQRLYIGIDVSGSMDYNFINRPAQMTARMGACAMAMALARREPHHVLRAFSSKTWNDNGMAPLDITAGDSLTDAMAKTNAMGWGGTDCALPMLDAMDNDLPVDCFVILTDGETWAGDIHPMAALRQYREKTGIPAKLVSFAMVANRFSVADPEDAGTMDVVGFDAAAPLMISQFLGAQVETGQEDEEGV